MSSCILSRVFLSSSDCRTTNRTNQSTEPTEPLQQPGAVRRSDLGASADCRYIASQAPLSATLVDFWRMIWQHDVKVIVMACREVEMGKKKCECYWSPPHQSADFGPFSVSTDTHSLIQYQFLSWPDHDVPYEAAGVLDLLERVRTSQGTHTSPMLIHCSAGCGRTGVICALDYIHDLLVTKQITADFSIMKIILELRKQRPSAVQTKDQYHFIFTTVTVMFERVLQSSRGPLYSNLPELKKTEKNKKTPAAKRVSQLTDMSDTYAVVNKPKHPHPPSPNPAYSTVATPRSRTPSHHYDNDTAAAAALYSTVRPRAKPASRQHSTTPIYDTATPTNHRVGEGPPLLSNSGDYHLMPADPADDDYEDFSSSATDVTNLCSPGGIGFNCRIQKPRGPREPPAEWSRLER